jgi:hypothetical protein
MAYLLPGFPILPCTRSPPPAQTWQGRKHRSEAAFASMHSSGGLIGGGCGVVRWGMGCGARVWGGVYGWVAVRGYRGLLWGKGLLYSIDILFCLLFVQYMDIQYKNNIKSVVLLPWLGFRHCCIMSPDC